MALIFTIGYLFIGSVVFIMVFILSTLYLISSLKKDGHFDLCSLVIAIAMFLMSIPCVISFVDAVLGG